MQEDKGERPAPVLQTRARAMLPAMSFSTLRLEVHGTVGELVLDHGAHNNALNAIVLEELILAARWFDERPEVRAVIVRGEGRFFCPGADLKDPPILGVLPASGKDWLARREHGQLGLRMIEAMEGMRAVTVCAAHGAAVGGGLLLMIACDFRVVAEGTRLQIPELELGVPLAWGGIPRLMAELGPARAKALVMTGRLFSPAEALQMGLAHEVVSTEDLLPRARALAASLGAKPSVPMAVTKEHIRAVRNQAMGTAFSFFDGDVLMGLAKDPEMMEAALRGRGLRPGGG